MAPVRIVVLVSAVTALAGCGGSSDPETFTADANAVCKERIDAIEKAVNGPDDAAAADVAEAYEAELSELRDLEPPSDSAGSYDELLDRYEAGARSWREFVELRDKAEESTDRQAYNERIKRWEQASVDSRRERTQGNKVAKELGLDTCSTPLY